MNRLFGRFAKGASGSIPDRTTESTRDEAQAGDISLEVTRRLDRVLSGLTDAVLGLDHEGNIILSNDAATTLLSSGERGLVGRAFGWALPNQAAIDALRAVQKTGVAESQMIELSERRHMRLDIARIDGAGQLAMLASITNLTDLFRTDQVRRDFVANVSHELRTPLASIKAVIETLESGGLEDEAAARDFLARANHEVDRIVQLVEELLELSRIESGAPIATTLIDIGPAVGRAAERLRPQAERRGMRLDVDIDPHLPAVRGDTERLERVAVNLIQNAINFTQEGGSIAVRATQRDGAVEVSVRDTGVGISPEEQPRVFERFYKVDRARGAGGTGLGLAIVKHTVEAHGGSVLIESQLGRGSTFTFTLPVSDE